MNPQTILVPAAERERAADRIRMFVLNCTPGKRLKVRIEEDKPERSDCQNRALWGVAYRELREQTGNDPEDLHAYFLGEYFGWVERRVMGMTKKRPRRTTTTDDEGRRCVMPKTEFADFYAFIQRRAAEAGYYVSDPDPFWFEKAA